MFKFKIFELPEGKSTESISLDDKSLELDEVKLNTGNIDVEFEKTSHFIRAVLDISANLRLVCDRSLDEFDQDVEASYQVLFKFEEIEESIDENGAIRNIDRTSNQINIEQDVLDTILVNLPSKKLHPRFLDEDGNPKEFLNEQFGASDEEEEETIDPRWAALKDLKK